MKPLSQYKYSMCACGNRASVIKQNQGVCSRCDEIEHRMHTYTPIQVKKVKIDIGNVYRVPGL